MSKDKPLKVDREKFEGIVKRLLQSDPLKREDVKVSKKKPTKLIPPQNPALESEHDTDTGHND